MAEVQDIRVLTFDCYGTLIDWERGMEQVFQRVLADKGSTVAPHRFRARWEPLQFALNQGSYQPCRDILRQSLAAALASYHLPYTPQDGDAFANSMATWEPFSDVPANLRRLKERYRLAIISNTDNEVIQESVKRLGVEFDSITTAEDARAYKPRPEAFRLALSRLGVPPERVLHIAFGFQYDIAAAQAVGMRTLWLNRKEDPTPPGAQPDWTARDFHQVVGLLLP